jgi:hypothetical protein
MTTSAAKVAIDWKAIRKGWSFIIDKAHKANTAS